MVKQTVTINVLHIDDPVDLEKAFTIRELVFIDEQKVDRTDEFDEFDDSSHHFLAMVDGIPAGTCRWRLTDEGYKLERFATLAQFRKKGVGGRLMEAMLQHITGHKASKANKLYLNAQIEAMPLYIKFGFEEEGERFIECGIQHQKMSRKLT